MRLCSTTYGKWCRRRDSNPHVLLRTQDFKSCASAISPLRQITYYQRFEASGIARSFALYPIFVSRSLPQCELPESETGPRKREENLSKDGKWRSFPKVPHLLQYITNGNYYGRIKISGKLIRLHVSPMPRSRHHTLTIINSSFQCAVRLCNKVQLPSPSVGRGNAEILLVREIENPQRSQGNVVVVDGLYYFQRPDRITADPLPQPYVDLSRESILKRVLVTEVLRQAFGFLQISSSNSESVHGEFGEAAAWSQPPANANGGPTVADLVSSSIVRDVVGKLVLVAGMAREVFRQQFSGAQDSVQDTVGKIAFPKMGRNLPGNFLPEFVPALRVNGGISDDGEFFHARRNENQHGVFLLRFVHAQMSKRLLRGGHCVFRLLATDEDADFTPRLFLGLPDGFDDGVVLKLSQKLVFFHITNLSRRLLRQSFPRLRRIHRRQKTSRPMRNLLRPTIRPRQRNRPSRRWNTPTRACVGQRRPSAQ
jgi:hypothetical protein